MKHHVMLIQESVILTGFYLATEYNKTGEDNEIPDSGLSNDFSELTIREIREGLRTNGFTEIFSTIQQPNEQGKIVNVPIGQVGFLEMMLAGTAIITVFWFDINGLPVRQTVYDLRIEEK
jgi:hypothetical protein